MTSNIKVAWVAENLTTGGIGTVCRYAAEGLMRHNGWRATVVSLRPSPSDRMDPITGVRYVGLGLGKGASRLFLRWLKENPQDITITNDVARIEPAFPYFPPETLHVVAIHDSPWSHVGVGVRNHNWVDGIACVANHIQDRLRDHLKRADFRGLLATLHNGAAFPPAPTRASHSGPLRLLFMGSMDPFKGILDLVPILQRLKHVGVPTRLIVAGGYHDLLQRRFREKHLESLVTWAGWVPHEECYRLAENSDVFLMLSRKEAFGMVTIEAMAMGCVPLAYDVESGNREIIENDKSGLLLPLGNFSAMANAMQTLHQNREKWRQLSDGAMVRARTQFNAETMVTQLCEFLKRVHASAQTHPSERKPGLPSEVDNEMQAKTSHYQRLSPNLRVWIRNRIGASPRLCNWFLNRR